MVICYTDNLHNYVNHVIGATVKLSKYWFQRSY